MDSRLRGNDGFEDSGQNARDSRLRRNDGAWGIREKVSRDRGIDQTGLRSDGWFTPSLVGTSPRSKGLTPSRQPTLYPYSSGFERR